MVEEENESAVEESELAMVGMVVEESELVEEVMLLTLLVV